MFRIQSLSLVQFKNYTEASFSFNHRVIGICGPNGKGKTNLLDAIYYLCFTKSYFTRSDQVNARVGMLGFRIEGHFLRAGKKSKAVCILRETGKKEFAIDEENYEKFARHIGTFPCVLIAPDDVQMITAGSEERRRFLDVLLCQLDPDYLNQLIGYNKVLQQRNSYLRQFALSKINDPQLLSVYDAQLIQLGTLVFEKRKLFLQSFIPAVTTFYHQIAGSEEEVDIRYESQLLQYSFDQLLGRFQDRDFLLQRTNGGIHKDDLQLSFREQPFKLIASQGQRKSLLFALKLAEFEVLKNAKGFSPLLLLDDVFEKLDEQRMHHLLNWVCVRNEGQIFITDTHESRITTHLEALGVSFELIRL